MASTKLMKKAMLEALEKSLGVVTTAAKIVGINRNTHYLWTGNDAKYKAKVAEIEELALDFVESKLFKQIENGEVASTIFYLKTKGKKRGYIERQEFAEVPYEPTYVVLPGGQMVSIS